MLTNDDKAILLLCSHIGLKDETLKPLTLKSWNELASAILKSNVKRPGNLFALSKEEMYKELNIPKADIENILKLLSRSLELGVDLDRLYSKGINVVTRASSLYPRKLKKVLKDLAPPVLFYCGNISLLDKDGIGVVGSRKVEEVHIEFTKKLVQQAVSENLIIYSGGAKGIDDISQKEAFLRGGSYVSFLADSLEKKIKNKEVRENIESGRVLLITSSKPDAGFQVGLAMNRNKYIYASSKATFVIASDYNKGGTWNGAIQNMRHNWTKTFVKQDSKSKGIQELIKLGANPIEKIEGVNLLSLIDNSKNIKTYNEENFEQIGIDTLIQLNNQNDLNKEAKYENTKIEYNTEEDDYKLKNTLVQEKEVINFDLYNHVIDIILEVLKEEKNLDELSEILNVKKSQLREWINRGIDSNKIKKLSKPVRYVSVNKK